jgi:hypothetical protein
MRNRKHSIRTLIGWRQKGPTLEPHVALLTGRYIMWRSGTGPGTRYGILTNHVWRLEPQVQFRFGTSVRHGTSPHLTSLSHMNMRMAFKIAVGH